MLSRAITHTVVFSAPRLIEYSFLHIQPSWFVVCVRESLLSVVVSPFRQIPTDKISVPPWRTASLTFVARTAECWLAEGAPGPSLLWPDPRAAGLVESYLAQPGLQLPLSNPAQPRWSLYARRGKGFNRWTACGSSRGLMSHKMSYLGNYHCL